MNDITCSAPVVARHMVWRDTTDGLAQTGPLRPRKAPRHLGTYCAAAVLVKRHSEDAPVTAAMCAA